MQQMECTFRAGQGVAIIDITAGLADGNSARLEQLLESMEMLGRSGALR
jgi:hypothetical protein